MSRKRIVTYVAERFDRELTGFGIRLLDFEIGRSRYRGSLMLGGQRQQTRHTC